MPVRWNWNDVYLASHPREDVREELRINEDAKIVRQVALVRPDVPCRMAADNLHRIEDGVVMEKRTSTAVPKPADQAIPFAQESVSLLIQATQLWDLEGHIAKESHCSRSPPAAVLLHGNPVASTITSRWPDHCRRFANLQQSGTLRNPAAPRDRTGVPRRAAARVLAGLPCRSRAERLPPAGTHERASESLVSIAVGLGYPGVGPIRGCEKVTQPMLRSKAGTSPRLWGFASQIAGTDTGRKRAPARAYASRRVVSSSITLKHYQF